MRNYSYSSIQRRGTAERRSSSTSSSSLSPPLSNKDHVQTAAANAYKRLLYAFVTGSYKLLSASFASEMPNILNTQSSSDDTNLTSPSSTPSGRPIKYDPIRRRMMNSTSSKDNSYENMNDDEFRFMVPSNNDFCENVGGLAQVLNAVHTPVEEEEEEEEKRRTKRKRRVQQKKLDGPLVRVAETTNQTQCLDVTRGVKLDRDPLTSIRDIDLPIPRKKGASGLKKIEGGMTRRTVESPLLSNPQDIKNRYRQKGRQANNTDCEKNGNAIHAFMTAGDSNESKPLGRFGRFKSALFGSTQNDSKANQMLHKKQISKLKKKKGKKISTPGSSLTQDSCSTNAPYTRSSINSTTAVNGDTGFRPYLGNDHNAREGTESESINAVFYENGSVTSSTRSDWRTDHCLENATKEPDNYGKGRRPKSTGVNAVTFHTRRTTRSATKEMNDILFESKYYEDHTMTTSTNKKKRKRTINGDDYYNDKNFSSGFKSRSSSGLRRSARIKKKPDNSVIEILSSDDDSTKEPHSDIELAKAISLGISPSKRRPGDRSSVDVVRIAIGKKVFCNYCQFQIQTGTMQPKFFLSFKIDDNEVNRHEVNLNTDIILEFKYFLRDEFTPIDDDENQLPFIAMSVVPSERNGFNKYPNVYLQSHGGTKEPLNVKKYIVIECRDQESLKKAVDRFRENTKCSRPFHSFFSKDCNLTPGEISQYTAALREDDRVSRKMRTRNTKRKVHDSEKVLLVFPFSDEGIDLEVAAVDLKEASRLDTSFVPQTKNCVNHGEKQIQERSHYLTIRNEDFARLEPGEFLNDTLIDFWMQWLWRKEKISSEVHFFSSHFFTALHNGGVTSVKSWTIKKGIDVFKKSLIFVPINESLHWSLCVIVNPGAVIDVVENDVDDSSNDIESEEELKSAIIFLDSLKAHKAGKVARILRDWLRYEFNRKNSDSSINPSTSSRRKRDDLFSPKTFPLLKPKIPYQDNCWDCGVFACRYAYALYARYLSGWRLTSSDLKFARQRVQLKESVITDHETFDFGMPEIRILREDMKKLVGNLSNIYLEVKCIKDVKHSEGKSIAKASVSCKNESMEKQSAVDEEHAERLKADANPEITSAVNDRSNTMDVNLSDDIHESDGSMIIGENRTRENKANGSIESLVNEVAVGFSQGSDHLVHDTSSIEKVEEDNGSENKLVEIRSR